jgi:hypothetical protein
MATSAMIAFMNTDGEIFTTTTASDGYLSWTGQKLYDFYNTYELAEQLVMPGDIYQVTDSLDDIGRFCHRVLAKIKYSSLDDFLADKGSYDRRPGVYLNGYVHVYLFMNNTWYYHKDNELHLLREFVNRVEPTRTFADKIQTWVKRFRFKIGKAIIGV